MAREVFARFGRKMRFAELKPLVGWDHGTYTIGLAVGFATCRLRVIFFSDPDPALEGREAELYARARELGVTFEPSAPIQELYERRRLSRGVLVAGYVAPEGEPHFSIVAACALGKVFTREHVLELEEFERAFAAEGLLRQALLVTRRS